MAEDSIEIRREKPTAKQLCELYINAGWIESLDGIDFQKSIDNSSLWIVAKQSGSVIGVARLQTDFVWYCCIYDLIVRDSSQGSGVGSRIMEEVLEICKDAGVRVVHLWPTKGKSKFYERFGFKPLGPDQPLMLLKSF